MDSEFFARIKAYTETLQQNNTSKQILQTELLEKYNKIIERKDAKVQECDYCSQKKGNLFLNIGKDIKSLKLLNGTGFVQILCCMNCTIKYMGTFTCI